MCEGNHHIEVINYQATYILTAHFDHMRLAFLIAARYALAICHMFVYTGFLGVHLEEEIYMHPPQGYFHLLQNGSCYNHSKSKTSRKMVPRMRKSIYGVKQSSHFLYGTFKDFMISIVFVASRVDGGLFVLEN